MRSWVHALTLGGDPVEAAARVLAGLEAVAPFDRAMRALDRGSVDQLTFQRPCYSHVDDGEAAVLAIWRAVRLGEHATARATLRLLVDEVAAGEAASAMAQVAALLANAPVGRD
ncbi:hypothetical protein [Sphingomonas bacterium]|uniref:hypothetical protein n=1 Tax=Sphingomonas bacterium TaxID=1895847 RepID=UPI0015755BD5|nr:hypothetical protein [Sphingomonas bacterium]